MRDDDDEPSAPLELPRMGMDEAEGLAWVQACVDAFCANLIGTKKFAALMAASSKVATLAKHHHERTEVARLIKAVADMKIENDRAEERQRAIQQGRAPH